MSNKLHMSLKSAILAPTFIPKAPVKVVTTEEQLDLLHEYWVKHNVDTLYVDTETKGLIIHDGYETFNEAGKGFDVPHPVVTVQIFDGLTNFLFNVPKFYQEQKEELLKNMLREWFDTETVRKHFYNAKFDINMLMGMDIYTRNRWCLYLASKLAFDATSTTAEREAKHSLSLQAVAAKWLNYDLDKCKQLSFGSRAALDGRLTPEQIQYGCLDVEILAPLHGFTHQVLAETDQLDAAAIDSHATAGVAFLERGGVPVDEDRLIYVIRQEQLELERLLEQKEFSELGNVNTNSGPKVKALFLKKFNYELSTLKKESLLFEIERLTANNDPKNAKLLESLKLLYDIRTFSNKAEQMRCNLRFAKPMNKGKSLVGYSSHLEEIVLNVTTTRKLAKMEKRLKDQWEIINPGIPYGARYQIQVEPVKRDPTVIKWLTTNFNQNKAVTSRFSSSGAGKKDKTSGKVNLQNLKKSTRLATYVPKGYKTICIDYPSIEIYLLMQLAQVKGSIEAINKGLDNHKYMASMILDIPYEQVTKKQRGDIKAITFGILYGQGPRATAEKLGIEFEKAVALIKKYFAGVPEVRDFLAQMVAQAMNDGFVTLESGKRRYVKLDENSKKSALTAAERQACNSPMQGLCAEIMKMALGSTADEIYEKGLENEITGGATVHDETMLIADCRKDPDMGKKAATILYRNMKKPVMDILPDLNMELTADVERHWAKETYVYCISQFVYDKEDRKTYEWLINNYHNYGEFGKFALNASKKHLKEFVENYEKPGYAGPGCQLLEDFL